MIYMINTTDTLLETKSMQKKKEENLIHSGKSSEKVNSTLYEGT